VTTPLVENCPRCGRQSSSYTVDGKGRHLFRCRCGEQWSRVPPAKGASWHVPITIDWPDDEVTEPCAFAGTVPVGVLEADSAPADGMVEVVSFGPEIKYYTSPEQVAADFGVDSEVYREALAALDQFDVIGRSRQACDSYRRQIGTIATCCRCGHSYTAHASEHGA
jgi:transcription elongation factor Elf1